MARTIVELSGQYRLGEQVVPPWTGTFHIRVVDAASLNYPTTPYGTVYGQGPSQSVAVRFLRMDGTLINTGLWDGTSLFRRTMTLSATQIRVEVTMPNRRTVDAVYDLYPTADVWPAYFTVVMVPTNLDGNRLWFVGSAANFPVNNSYGLHIAGPKAGGGRWETYETWSNGSSGGNVVLDSTGNGKVRYNWQNTPGSGAIGPLYIGCVLQDLIADQPYKAGMRWVYGGLPAEKVTYRMDVYSQAGYLGGRSLRILGPSPDKTWRAVEVVNGECTWGSSIEIVPLAADVLT